MKFDIKLQELDIKRLYVDNVTIRIKCSECGHINKVDLGQDYLSYPAVGEWEKNNTCCEECYEDIDFETKVSSTPR